jgi:hypothetical protein
MDVARAHNLPFGLSLSKCPSSLFPPALCTMEEGHFDRLSASGVGSEHWFSITTIELSDTLDA